MAKDDYFGSELDSLYRSKNLRVPGYAIYIWNPHRTTITDVVLGEEESPRYDITHWTVSVDYNENIIFENNDDSVASSATIELRYAPNAQPIEITERTLQDGTPLQIVQGDRRIDTNDWIPVFTGVIQGNPQVIESTRLENQQKILVIQVVERAAAFLKNVVTAKSYPQGEDIGQVAVETAVEFMGLERREIQIGDQGYVIGHPQSQIVDIQVLSGIAQVLFTVGKKPKFNATGFLTAVDTDFDKAPARIHSNEALIVEVIREQINDSINNSFRLRGLSNELTEVVERETRLAHGNITSGFFESSVRLPVYFSESAGDTQGGRRAKETDIRNVKISSLGEFFGESVGWNPFVEPDGISVFGGEVNFDTGSTPDLRIGLIAAYAGAAIIGLASAYSTASALGTVTGTAIAGVGLVHVAQELALVLILLSMVELGSVEFDIVGKPFQYVYEEIVASDQLIGVTSSNLREIENRNDWFYDIDVLESRAKELLRREVAKGWTYRIVMMDDPLLEVDDILQIGTRKYYVINIRKRFHREGAPEATMVITAWRIK